MQVKIKKFTKDGLGLTEGKAILVPYTLEGEEVEITPPFKKKGMRFGEALQILQPSKERITPFCPHFGVCGGCLTQHWDYKHELAWKETFVKELFKDFPHAKFLPILGAEKMERWRNKMEFSFAPSGEVGLYRFFGKRDIFDTYHCSLGPSWFQEALDAIRDWKDKYGVKPYDPIKNRGSLRHLTVRHGYRTDDRMLFLTVSDEPWTEEQLAAYKKIGEGFNAALFTIIQKVAPGQPTRYIEQHILGPKYLREKLTVSGKELTFHISPRAFFQPNPLQAEKVYQQAFDLLELQGDELLLDLFAGTGTLGLFAAPFVKKVISIELSVDACQDARVNRKNNGIENLEILQGDVGKLLKKRAIPQPDALLVDPPRAGLTPDAIEAILHLQPEKVCYISCNPETQSHDAAALSAGGYTLETIIPIDQFPRSPHVENIALFKKKHL